MSAVRIACRWTFCIYSCLHAYLGRPSRCSLEACTMQRRARSCRLAVLTTLLRSCSGSAASEAEATMLTRDRAVLASLRPSSPPEFLLAFLDACEHEV